METLGAGVRGSRCRVEGQEKEIRETVGQEGDRGRRQTLLEICITTPRSGESG